MKNALAQSINIPAIKALYLAGIDNFLKTIKKFGINTLTERSRYGLSLILGGGEVKLIELVNAYATLAQEGQHHDQTLILSIQDKNGKFLETYRDNTNKVYEPEPIRIINEILYDIQARSALYQSSLPLTVFPGHQIALKTGTTNDYRDAWAVGYAPDFVVGVWAGNNDNSPMQRRGSSLLAAVPIWSSFMKETLKNRNTELFERPNTKASQKPMLNGESTVKFVDQNNNEYLQIHNILFYVDKNNPLGPIPTNPGQDPQFENWEKGVLVWARNNISNFDLIYNKSLPPNITYQTANQDSFIRLENLNIKNGDFVSMPFNLTFNIKSSNNLRKIEILLNSNIIDVINLETENNLKEYLYNRSVTNILNLQNKIEIKIYSENGQSEIRDLVVYKNNWYES